MTDLASLHEQAVRLGPLEIAARIGFRLSRRNRGACPVHGGHNVESFSLEPKNGRLVGHCHSCGFGGDVFTLVGAIRGIDDFRGRVDAVCELLNMERITEFREPAQKTPRMEPLDPLSYHNIASAFIELCRGFEPIRDVASYLAERRLTSSYVDEERAAIMACDGIEPCDELFAIPERKYQRKIVTALCERFETESLIRASLLRRYEGRIIYGCLSWPEHRVGIIWRGVDDRIAIVQRRRIDDQAHRKYIFPDDMKPSQPFGADRLRTAPKNAAVAFTEGAFDTLALRVICEQEHKQIVPVGLPGVAGWRPGWAELAKGRHALIAFDDDEAGNKAVEDFGIALLSAGAIDVKRWRPKCKDWALTLRGAA